MVEAEFLEERKGWLETVNKKDREIETLKEMLSRHREELANIEPGRKR